MRTRRLTSTEGDVAFAAEVLRDGGLVAFPTETVYGLGADATSPAAVEAVFAAKGRPHTDPLIVHVTSVEAAAEAGDLEAAGPAAIRAVTEFWPGPLTVVVPRRPGVAAGVGGGLDTVGLRVPAHPLARRLIESAGVPVAAPSANRFGRISPTSAGHVLDELDGRIDAVVDGGDCPLGVESTVISFVGPTPRLLRPGGLVVEDLVEVLGDLEVPGRTVVPDGAAAESPGAFLGHYAPHTPVVLVEASAEVVATLLGRLRDVGVTAVALDTAGDPRMVASRLYRELRVLDGAGAELIVAAALDPGGLGRAVNDRLYRAAHGHLASDASDTTVGRISARLRADT